MNLFVKFCQAASIPFGQTLFRVGSVIIQPEDTPNALGWTCEHSVQLDALPSGLPSNRAPAASSSSTSSAVASAIAAARADSHGYVLEDVKRDGFLLQNASGRLRAQRDVVLAAVRQNGLALQFAADDLRSDPSIVDSALQQNVQAFSFAPRAVQEVLIKAAHDKDDLPLAQALAELQAP